MNLLLRALGILCCGGSLLAAAGCGSGPTYPKARLSDAVTSVLTSEGIAPTAVRVLEHTVAVQLIYPDALSQTGGHINVGPAFDEATRKIITSLHRVLLSTDADVRFYVVLLSDPNTPGAYLTIVRYLDDIRRANANMLDTPEIIARTVFELNAVGPAKITLDSYLPHEVRLEEFLSWQLARRIQRQLIEQVQQPGLATIGACAGRFQNREFAFTLDVAPSTGAPLDEATIQQVFQMATNEIAKVLGSYRFDSFDQVRLIHPLTGRNFVLPKARLGLFR
ncbi:MAG: hypothetical protein HY737_03735 [Candidatus Omnitrophica bacterium]|nr:hypothetical protein [Candidatus Omnitrophota bacterium]